MKNEDLWTEAGQNLEMIIVSMIEYRCFPGNRPVG